MFSTFTLSFVVAAGSHCDFLSDRPGTFHGLAAWSLPTISGDLITGAQQSCFCSISRPFSLRPCSCPSARGDGTSLARFICTLIPKEGFSTGSAAQRAVALPACNCATSAPWLLSGLLCCEGAPDTLGGPTADRALRSRVRSDALGAAPRTTPLAQSPSMDEQFAPDRELSQGERIPGPDLDVSAVGGAGSGAQQGKGIRVPREDIELMSAADLSN